MTRSNASGSDEDDGDQLTLVSSLSAPESTGWSVAADQSIASSATSLGGGENSSAASSRGAYALPNVYHRANRASVGDAGTIASGGSAGTARSGSRMLQRRARQQQHARASVVPTTTTTTTAEIPTNLPHPESGASISSDDSSTIKSIANSNLSYSSSNKHAAPSPYALPNVYNTRRIAHDEDAASGAGSAGTARSGRRLIQQQQRREHTVAVEETKTKKQKSEPPCSATSPSALPTRDTASEAGTSGDADGSGDGTTGTGMSGASGRVGIVPRRSDNTAEGKTEIGDEDESSVATPDPPYIDGEMLDREHARILNKKSWSGMKWKEMVVEPPTSSSGEDSSLPPSFAPVISKDDGSMGVPAVVSYSGADVAEAMERGTNMANNAEPSLLVSGGKTVGDGSTITSNYYAPFFHYRDGKIANEAENRSNRRAAAARRPRWFMLAVILLLIMVLAAATGATLCGLGYCKSTHSSKSQASLEDNSQPPNNDADTPTPPPDTAPQPTLPAPDSDAAWTPTKSPAPAPAPSPLVPDLDTTSSPTAAPIVTIPLAGETASPTAAPDTTQTLPASPAPSPSPTEPPVEPPTEPPVTSPPATAGPAFVVTSTDELRSAVDDYLAGILTVPINDWDVSLVSDFSELFSADRNPATVDFNEDLDRWDVSNAVTFMGLFRKAASFNGNIATWNTAKVSIACAVKCLPMAL